MLTSCGSSSDGSTSSTSKTVICGKALGVVVLSEVEDDAQRKAERAKDTADVLSTLARETQDKSLSSALSAAASQAGEATKRHLSGGGLKAWAAQEQQRFTALRKACI